MSRERGVSNEERRRRHLELVAAEKKDPRPLWMRKAIEDGTLSPPLYGPL